MFGRSSMTSTKSFKSALGIAACVFAAVEPNSAHAQSTRDAELAEADGRLNFTYQALMGRLTPIDQRALRAAQRLWIQFRDSDCTLGWGDMRDCLIQRTEEREKQFRNSIYFDASGTQIVLPHPQR